MSDDMSDAASDAFNRDMAEAAEVLGKPARTTMTPSDKPEAPDASPADEVDCPRCLGDGTLVEPHEPVCPDCKGTGKVAPVDDEREREIRAEIARSDKIPWGMARDLLRLLDTERATVATLRAEVERSNAVEKQLSDAWHAREQMHSAELARLRRYARLAHLNRVGCREHERRALLLDTAIAAVESAQPADDLARRLAQTLRAVLDDGDLDDAEEMLAEARRAGLLRDTAREG